MRQSSFWYYSDKYLLTLYTLSRWFLCKSSKMYAYMVLLKIYFSGHRRHSFMSIRIHNTNVFHTRRARALFACRDRHTDSHFEVIPPHWLRVNSYIYRGEIDFRDIMRDTAFDISGFRLNREYYDSTAYHFPYSTKIPLSAYIATVLCLYQGKIPPRCFEGHAIMHISEMHGQPSPMLALSQRVTTSLSATLMIFISATPPPPKCCWYSHYHVSRDCRRLHLIWNYCFRRVSPLGAMRGALRRVQSTTGCKTSWRWLWYFKTIYYLRLFQHNAMPQIYAMMMHFIYDIDISGQNVRHATYIIASSLSNKHIYQPGFI